VSGAVDPGIRRQIAPDPPRRLTVVVRPCVVRAGQRQSQPDGASQAVPARATTSAARRWLLSVRPANRSVTGKTINRALDDPHHSVTCRPSPRQRRNQACLAGGIDLPACVAALDGSSRQGMTRGHEGGQGNQKLDDPEHSVGVALACERRRKLASGKPGLVARDEAAARNASSRSDKRIRR